MSELERVADNLEASGLLGRARLPDEIAFLVEVVPCVALK